MFFNKNVFNKVNGFDSIFLYWDNRLYEKSEKITKLINLI